VSVRFAKGATTVDLQNPQVGNVLATRKTQVHTRDAGGGRYVYDQGVETQIVQLVWAALRESEKDALQGFFEDDANGMKESFTYTDHEGDDWTAYFDQPELEFVEIGDQRASAGTFSSGGTSYPTTTRQNGVYRVQVQLEVTAA